MKLLFAKSLLQIFLGFSAGLLLPFVGQGVQAQSCTGTVQCGDWEGGVYLCPDNSECQPATGCPSGTCVW